MDRAAGLKAVRMSGNPTHGVYRDGTTEHRPVTPTSCIGPWLIEYDRLVEGDLRDLGGDPAGGLGRDPTAVCHCLGGIVRRKIAIGKQGERWAGSTSIGKPVGSEQSRIEAVCFRIRHAVGGSVPGERPSLGVAREKPVIGRTRRVDYEIVRIGVADQESRINVAAFEQAMNKSQDK